MDETPKLFLNYPNCFQISDNTLFAFGDIFIIQPIHKSLEATHICLTDI